MVCSWGLEAEMAKVHTSFTLVVQILMFNKTLVKVEVLTTLFHSKLK